MRSHDDALEAFLQLLVAMPDAPVLGRSIAAGPLRSLQPASVTLHLQTSTADVALRLVAHHGLGAGLTRTLGRLPFAARWPAHEVLATGETLRLELPQLAEAFPLMHAFVAAHAEGQTFLAAPLTVQAVPIGVLGVVAPHAAVATWEAATAVRATTAALSLWAAATGGLEGASANPAIRTQVAITERQQRVVDLIRQGCTNAEIARALGFSVGTIKADITALSATLGAHGREDLARRAQRAGL